MQLPNPEVNCSICDKPVALETAKTDEFARAVHEECYLLKLGVKMAPGSILRPVQMQTLTFKPGSQ
jgi:hypothetical protein